MKLCKTSFYFNVRHDLINGIMRNWKKYAMASILFTLLCFSAFISHNNILHNATLLAANKVEPKLSFGDYLIYLYKGMNLFDSNDHNFSPNVFWLLINIYLAYIVSFYPFKDMEGYGQQILLRSQNRLLWWISKCVWNICSVLTFYFTSVITLFVFTLCTGNIHFLPEVGNQKYLTELSVDSITASTMFLTVILIPMLTSIALSLFQMFLSLFIKPLLSLVAIIVILVASIYINSWIVPGNFLMSQRSEVFIPNTGINFEHCLLILLVLGVLSIVLGSLLFKKFDIINKTLTGV